MSRYRIMVQDREIKDKIIKCISFETEQIDKIITNIEQLLAPEIEKRQNGLRAWLMRGFKKHPYVDEDKIDLKAKGKDISKEEYIDNEITMELL